MAIIRQTEKYALVNAVLKDQYTDVVVALKKELKDLYSAQAKEQDAGLTKKVKDVFISEGKNITETTWFRTENEVTTCNYHVTKEYFSVDEHCKPSLSKWNRDLLFVFSTHAVQIDDYYVKPTNESYLLVPVTPEYKLLVERVEAVFDEIEDMKNNLIAVISSVKTFKQLTELTTVFEPFIINRGPAECTSMLPAEAICAVNLLKSPKKTKNLTRAA